MALRKGRVTDWTRRARSGPVRFAALLLAGLVAVGLWAAARVAPSELKTCQVEAVLDGDSLRLRCGGKTTQVRLYCIDAPEHGQSPWGKQSRRHLRDITPRRVELEPIERDRFERVVGNLYAPGTKRRLLNLEQVRAGQAAVYDRYCADPRFPRAEREARKARRGIWSKRGEHRTPWVYRHRQGR